MSGLNTGAETPLRQTLTAPSPYSMRRSLSGQKMGPGDPTFRLSEGLIQLATLGPDGPATLRVAGSDGRMTVEAWGPGADRAAASVPDLLGFSDPAERFQPPEGPVRRLLRRAPGLRLPRLSGVYVRTVQAVLLQLVASKDAFVHWRRLVDRLGDRAPGPLGLSLPPRPEALAEAPAHLFSACGLTQRRATTLRAVAKGAERLDAGAAAGWTALRPQLLRIPGVGPWTAEYVRGSALGDPDAVLQGDYNLPNTVAWALAGEPRATDARMLELLEPFRGDRYRVVRLIHAAGVRAPRRGHRRPLRTGRHRM